MGVASLINKLTYVAGKPFAVRTEWWRIPYLDTPECLLNRKYMLERTDYDPLSKKLITIIKAQLVRDEIVKNRYGVPVYLATYNYKHSTTKEQLEAIHNKLCGDLKDGTFVLGEVEGPDGVLRDYIEGMLYG